MLLFSGVDIKALSAQRPSPTWPVFTKSYDGVSYLHFFLKLNVEIITSIYRMNYSFYHRLLIHTSMINRAGQTISVQKMRLHQSNHEWATGYTYVCCLLRY